MAVGRARRVSAAAVLAACAIAGLGACTGSGSGDARASAGASGSAAASGAPGASTGSGASSRAQTSPTTGARSSRHSSPLPSSAPGHLTTVPTRTVRTLPAVPLRSRAAFGTGVSAEVTAVTHGVDHDRGAGAATGRPTVEFHLRLTNGTQHRLAVSDVEVQAAYGSSTTPAISASSGTRPFHATIAPGATQGAVYSFAVPSSGQGKVKLTVSYTAGKPTVVLSGSAR